MEICPYFIRLARTPHCKVDGGMCRPVTIAMHESDPTAAKLDADAERDCVEGYKVTVIDQGGNNFIPKVPEAAKG